MKDDFNMSSVSIVRCDDYSQEKVDPAVEKLIENLGGVGNFIKEGSKVLLKPNLLVGKHPDRAITTHPSIVAAVVKLLKKHNCKIAIGESPAIETCRSAAMKAGYSSISDCEIIDFKECFVVNSPDNLFKDIEIAAEIKNYDYVINLPKVKTHGQMGLSLGVKNMFGSVIGLKKVQWHFKSGINKDFFAKMLVDVYRSVKPVLTITDGIIGMEGNGPQNGNPRKLGLIIASEDAVASDVVISHLIGYDPEKLFTNIAARVMKVGTTRLNEINITGEPLSAFEIVNFKKVPVSSLEFRLPGFIASPLKEYFSTKPVLNNSTCTLCNICKDVCPAKVIKLKNEKLIIDHRNCIRCFCCQELCPRGAITVKKGLLSGIFG